MYIIYIFLTQCHSNLPISADECIKCQILSISNISYQLPCYAVLNI